MNAEAYPFATAWCRLEAGYARRMEWLAIFPIAISTLALIVSGVSAYIAVVAFRRTVAKESPLFTASVEHLEGRPGWYRVMITLESRTNHGYRCEKLDILRPRAAKGVAEEKTRTTPDGFGNNDLAPDFGTLPVARAMPMTLSVSSAGAMRAGLLGQGDYRDDRHWERFLVFAPGSSSKTLSMRVTLLSTEATERRTRIMIQRTLPADVKTAID